MARKTRRGVAWATAAAALATVAVPSPAFAADFQFDLGAGIACSFELRVTGDVGTAKTREFTDAEGNVVRVLTAGRGADLTFQNLGTGETLSLRGNGSVSDSMVHADGSQTVRSTGHNVIILFPTDPDGPSTTLYVGRVTYEADPQSSFTITGWSGRTVDICTELS
jgi:hypothetical protein